MQRKQVNRGAFKGNPKLLKAADELQVTLDATGLSADPNIIYQLDFLFCDRVTCDQVTCLTEIIRLAVERSERKRVGQ